VEFRLLGSVEICRGGQAVALGGAYPRAVLAVLLLRYNQVVSADRLVDVVWKRPPRAAGSNLRTYVARLRRMLHEPGGDTRLQTRSGGYLLDVRAGELDLMDFEAFATRGERARADGAPGRAAEMFGHALAMWRGEPLAGLDGGSWLAAEVVRLEERRLAVAEGWAETSGLPGTVHDPRSGRQVPPVVRCRVAGFGDRGGTQRRPDASDEFDHGAVGADAEHTTTPTPRRNP
jgi:DNA-binding SARP family transcriptional activator